MSDRYALGKMLVQVDDGVFFETTRWYVIDTNTDESVASSFENRKTAEMWVAHFNRIDRGLS